LDHAHIPDPGYTGDMNAQAGPQTRPPTSYQARYRIRVRGHLDTRWAAWFDGMTITHEPGGDSVLSGLVPDQAALHGRLARLRDLGLTLVSVSREEDLG